jgi:hypothetical protein
MSSKKKKRKLTVLPDHDLNASNSKKRILRENQEHERFDAAHDFNHVVFQIIVDYAWIPWRFLWQIRNMLGIESKQGEEIDDYILAKHFVWYCRENFQIQESFWHSVNTYPWPMLISGGALYGFACQGTFWSGSDLDIFVVIPEPSKVVLPCGPQRFPLLKQESTTTALPKINEEEQEVSFGITSNDLFKQIDKDLQNFHSQRKIYVDDSKLLGDDTYPLLPSNHSICLTRRYYLRNKSDSALQLMVNLIGIYSDSESVKPKNQDDVPRQSEIPAIPIPIPTKFPLIPVPESNKPLLTCRDLHEWILASFDTPVTSMCFNGGDRVWMHDHIRKPAQSMSCDYRLNDKLTPADRLILDRFVSWISLEQISVCGHPALHIKDFPSSGDLPYHVITPAQRIRKYIARGVHFPNLNNQPTLPLQYTGNCNSNAFCFNGPNGRRLQLSLSPNTISEAAKKFCNLLPHFESSQKRIKRSLRYTFQPKQSIPIALQTIFACCTFNSGNRCGPRNESSVNSGNRCGPRNESSVTCGTKEQAKEQVHALRNAFYDFIDELQSARTPDDAQLLVDTIEKKLGVSLGGRRLVCQLFSLPPPITFEDYPFPEKPI